MLRTVRLQLSRPTTVATCVAAEMTRATLVPASRRAPQRPRRSVCRHRLRPAAPSPPTTRVGHRRRRPNPRTHRPSRPRYRVLPVEHDAGAPREDHHEPFGARSEHEQILGRRLDQVERDVLRLLAGANQRVDIHRADARSGSGIIASRTKALRSPHAAQNCRNVRRVGRSSSNCSLSARPRRRHGGSREAPQQVHDTAAHRVVDAWDHLDIALIQPLLPANGGDTTHRRRSAGSSACGCGKPPRAAWSGTRALGRRHMPS